ncbi:hypothetical protein [Sinorhizobium fredii]|uniref:hypothetical protein n=1 Tax=Rhizobium fredii TaxID=380 RepID=UPI0012976B93|nr:hypothetical protein [Sinorhizobium fredii]MQW94047.1 hypothetical protein [Sinorhizobium fredii]
MPTIRINKDYFAGSGKVWDRQVGLGAIIASLVADNARRVLADTPPAALTDNSGGAGTLEAGLQPFAKPAPLVAADGGLNMNFAASVEKLVNAHKVVAEALTAARAALGLPAVNLAEGNVAAANTIPALDDTANAAASGSAPVAHTSFMRIVAVTRRNQGKLLGAINEFRRAVGNAPFANAFGTGGGELAPTPDPVAAGADDAGVYVSVAVADATAFLVTARDNVAVIAAAWQAAIDGLSQPADLRLVAG